ncbi:MAG: terminase family protein [Caldilineaceae bacterium]
MNKSEILERWLAYEGDPSTFVSECVYIYDATGQDWVKFKLWPAQVDTLTTMATSRKLVILKARQLGISWLSLSYALWLMLFQAPATILLFSLREEESKELLWRLRGMYERLPDYLHARAVTHSNETRWILSNGSRALAFSTRSGRSYTGTLALVDEADFVPDLSQFLNGVKPTIDAGGQLFLVSTSDKKRPLSTFKNLFRAAKEGTGDYRHVFLPWWARPGRDKAWRMAVQAEMYAQRGTHDDFYAEYPASSEEALAAEQLDRRLPWEWVKRCVDSAAAHVHDTGERLLSLGRAESIPPSLPGLSVWAEPIAGHRYVIGADPAEGNPNSDESAACVLEAESWAQVAELTGKIEPSAFAGYLDELGCWYNNADVMAERNNHGHLLIRELQRLGNLRVLEGYDGRPGWLSTVKGKPLLYGILADAVRNCVCTIRGSETAEQLASIEASTLRCPEGLHDDRADAFALAIAAVAWKPEVGASMVVTQIDPLAAYDLGTW